jgi:hypothetical protein
MASKNQRRMMRSPGQVKKGAANAPPIETAKFLLHIDNVAKATRNSERKRKILEGDKNAPSQ